MRGRCLQNGPLTTSKGRIRNVHPTICYGLEKTLMRFMTTAPLYTVTHAHLHHTRFVTVYRVHTDILPKFFLQGKTSLATFIATSTRRNAINLQSFGFLNSAMCAQVLKSRIEKALAKSPVIFRHVEVTLRVRQDVGMLTDFLRLQKRF